MTYPTLKPPATHPTLVSFDRPAPTNPLSAWTPPPLTAATINQPLTAVTLPHSPLNIHVTDSTIGQTEEICFGGDTLPNYYIKFLIIGTVAAIVVVATFIAMTLILCFAKYNTKKHKL